jgi:AcrR family transcriptional regulator
VAHPALGRNYVVQNRYRCDVVTKSGEIEMSSISERMQMSPKRGEARSRAILDATIELLAEVGYDRMTMDTVAARAKASKATIYRRWPDKTALVLDALRSHGSLVPDLADTGSLRGDLQLYVRESAAATAGTDGSLVAGLLAVASRDRELGALFAQRFHDEQLPTIRALVDRARERQEIGPNHDAMFISEVLPGVLIMHLLVLGLPADEPFIHGLVDHVLIPMLEADKRLDPASP